MLTHDPRAVIMILSTTEADALAAKSGLSLVDLFRPFGEVDEPGVQVQTVGEPYRLRKFSMRFVHGQDMRPVPAEVAERHLTQLISTYEGDADAVAPGKRSSASEGAAEIKSIATPDNPWFDAFRAHLLASLRHAEHATVDHPVGALLISHSTQPHPASALQALWDASNLPAVLRDGLADQAVAKAYLLLHDVSAHGPADGNAECAAALADLTRSFGAAASKLLPLNSRADGKPPPPDLWSALRPPLSYDSARRPRRAAPPCAGRAAAPPAADAPPLGHLLSDGDIRGINEFITGPLTKLVTAHMNTKVYQLAATVKATRQGLKNTVRNWFGVKSEGDSPAPAPSGASAGGGPPRYTYNTIEAQMRSLADCALILRDYATANSYYRMAASEFKGDKSWRNYAACQEMAAVSLFLGDGARKEIDEALDKATAHFLKSSLPRHATRATILQLAVQEASQSRAAAKKARDSADAAVALVAQSTQESHLCAALLLELAATSYLAPRPRMARKYAFHLILAGFRFIQCSQRRHAVRAYNAALKVYAHRGWTHIEDHIHFTLGRNCAALGSVEPSLAFFLRLLRHSRQPQERQQTFMKEFIRSCAHPEHSRLSALPLPRFHDPSIKVLLNDHRQLSSTAAADTLSAAHPLWKPLVAPLLPPSEVAKGNWLTGNAGAAKEAAPAPCVVGEWVCVEVDIENPMHITIELSKLSLVCTHTPPADADAAAGAAATTGFEVDSHELVPAGKRALVRLSVRPLAEASFGSSAPPGRSGLVHGMRLRAADAV